MYVVLLHYQYLVLHCSIICTYRFIALLPARSVWILVRNALLMYVYYVLMY